MPYHVEPVAEICQRKGAVATIYSGDLPEFPAWFEEQLNEIVSRLREEARRYAQASKAVNHDFAAYLQNEP